MKQWKLVLVALLAVLLVCVTVGACAEETEHKDSHTTVLNPKVFVEVVDNGSYENHDKVYTQDTFCLDCNKVIKTETVVEQEAHNLIGVTVPSTCTVYGTYKEVCPVCGYSTKETKLTTLADHVTTLHEAVAPKCGKDGTKAYVTCKNCSYIWNETCDKLYDAIPVDPMPAAEHTWAISATVTEPDCVTDGEVIYKCATCGDTKTEKPAALGHFYDESKWEEQVPATCLNDGTDVNKCLRCGKGEIYRTVAKTGHDWAVEPEDLVKKTESVAKKYEIIKASDCTKEGAGYIYCTKCEEVKSVTIPAAGHDWNDWETKDVPDTTNPDECVAKKVATRTCKACTEGKEEVTVSDALDHIWVVLGGTEPTCEEDGQGSRKCLRCDKLEEDVVIPATGHDCEWFVIAEPSKEGDGIEELTCINCGEVFDVRTTPYTDMRYGTTITSFGPCTRDLIGGKTWNRVTPIDLSVEGTFTYPLIASNEFTVGTMTVTIKDGKATVSYKLNSTQIKVKSESLVIFNNLEALRAGTGVAAAVNAPVEVAQFEDGKVIIALKLVADYNAVGAGIRDFSADASQIAAMTGIID
jgi:hypothetical protein